MLIWTIDTRQTSSNIIFGSEQLKITYLSTNVQFDTERDAYTNRASLDLQTWFWIMVLVAMTTRKLAKRKTSMFFLWGKLFSKRCAPYPTKMQNPALKKQTTDELIYGILSIRVDMTCLPYIHANWIKRLFPYNYFL